MRACIQRVGRASVTVDNEVVGAIGAGLLVLLGVESDDAAADAHFLANKILKLRIFEDAAGKMNRSLLDAHGQMLVVSQFTLLGDCRHGRRPSFTRAAQPDIAESLYEQFAELAAQAGVRVARGRFQAHMKVELVNDGPVTLLLDSRKSF